MSEEYGYERYDIVKEIVTKDKFIINSATREGAFVILEINLHDAKARLDKYEQFENYKVLMEKDFPEGLIWDFAYIRESGTEVCSIYTKKNGIDLHRRINWLEFYKFMAEEMLKLEKAFRIVKEAIE